MKGMKLKRGKSCKAQFPRRKLKEVMDELIVSYSGSPRAELHSSKDREEIIYTALEIKNSI